MGFVDSLLSQLENHPEVQSILVFTLVFLLLLWLWNRSSSSSRRNLPPGPWGIPILGCLPNLAIQMARLGLEPGAFFAHLANSKYGKIFTLDIFGIHVVILNGYECTKKAFTNPVLNDRPACVFDSEMNMESGKL